MSLSEQIPQDEDSIEFLKWIGFTRETAISIHRYYATIPEDMKPDRGGQLPLFDVAEGHIVGICSRFWELPVTERLSRMGIRQDIKEAILAPDHKAVLQTETLVSWLKNTIHVHRDALDLLTQRKVIVEPWIRYQKSQPTPSLRPGFRRLYRAIAAPQIAEWYDNGDGDGQHAMHGLHFIDGGRFCYWTSERQTAEMYRAFIEATCPGADTWLVCIDVLEEFLQSVDKKTVWYSPDWKHYMWYSKIWSPFPEHLIAYEKADLIEVYVCGRHPKIIPRVGEREIDTRINEDWILKLPDGSKATQIAINCKLEERMAEQMKGNVQVEVTVARMMRRRSSKRTSVKKTRLAAA